jgi:translation initiation factor IF-1
MNRGFTLREQRESSETALTKAVRFGAPLLVAGKLVDKAGRRILRDLCCRIRKIRRFGCELSALSRMPDDVITTEGKIVAVLAGTMFRVELANNHVVLAHISGKMRKRFIRLTNGDRVKLEMSPYDLDKARITYRLG